MAEFVENIKPDDVKEKGKLPEQRHVVYSPTRGVYLGNNDWSRDGDPGEPKLFKGRTAPTFAKGLGAETVVKDARLVWVHPTGPNGSATSADCVAKLLPGWE